MVVIDAVAVWLTGLSRGEQRLLRQTLGRKRLFLWLSRLNGAVATLLAGYFCWQGWHAALVLSGLHGMLVLLLLLSARANLRHYRHAQLLGKLLAGAASPE